MKINFYKLLLISFLGICSFSVYSSPNDSFGSVKRDVILDDDKSMNIWTSLLVDNESKGSYLIHVKGDGQSVMFNGLLSISCSRDKIFTNWVVGRNWVHKKYNENDLDVVPKEVISIIEKKYCPKKSPQQ
jgi:hypothetical protein